MTRRLLLALPLAALLKADDEKDVADLIRSLADALSAGSVELFLSFFDHSMPGYDKLRANVTGLVAEYEIGCNIEIRASGGVDDEWAVTLDWILLLTHNDTTPGTTQREKTVKCQLKKSAGKWRIVSFDPLDLFAP